MSEPLEAKLAFKATQDTLTLAAIGFLALKLGLADELVGAIEELSDAMLKAMETDPASTAATRKAAYQAQLGVLSELRAFQSEARPIVLS